MKSLIKDFSPRTALALSHADTRAIRGELLLKKLGKVAARTIARTVDFLLERISAGQNESAVYNKIQKQFNIQAQPIRTN